MDYFEMIKKTIDQIETDITQPFRSSELSQTAHYSPYYYQRIFHAVVGDSVMGYIKKRRLSLAGKEIAATQRTILDIALQFGYESHEGFTRAFKSFHGITPSECRRTGIYQFRKREVFEHLSKGVMKMNGYQNTQTEIAAIVREMEQDASQIYQKLAVLAANQFNGFVVVVEEVKNFTERFKYIQQTSDSEGTAKDQINALLSTLKSMEDCVFQSRILGFNLKIEGKRIGQRFEDAGREYVQFTDYLVEKTVAATELLKKALLQDREHHSQIASQNWAQTEQTLQGIIRDINQLSQTLHSERSGALGILADEYAALGKRMESHVLEIASYINSDTLLFYAIQKTSERFWQLLKSVEDLAFQTNILAFGANVEFANASIIADYSKQPLDIATRSQRSAREFAELTQFIEQILSVNTIANSLDDEFQSIRKMFDDIAFQGNLLYFYTKIECAKSEPLHKYAVELAEFVDKFVSVNSLIGSYDSTDDMSELCTQVEGLGKTLAATTKRIRSELESMLKTDRHSFDLIIEEFSYYADRICFCAHTLKK